MLPTPAMPPAVRRPRGGVIRAGFTLIELLVACALTVLVMAILATAFQKGMETLSTLKSAVGLSEQLRSAEAVIRRDLANVRLETASGGPVRVSDTKLARDAWTDPNRGFFRIKHGSALSPPTTDPRVGYVQENSEDGVFSYRAWNHELAMTVKLPGGSSGNVFIADANGLPEVSSGAGLNAQSQPDYVPMGSGQFAGQWAEVAYFLAPSVMSTTAADGSLGLQLYTLRRRYRVLAPTSQVLVPLGRSGSPYNTPEDVARAFPEVSISPVQTGTSAPNKFAHVNTPADVASLANRLWDYRDFRTPGGPGPATTDEPDDRGTGRTFSQLVRALPASDRLGGSDVVLANVISFQVLPLTTNDTTQFADKLPNPNNVTLAPADYTRGAALDTSDVRTTNNLKPVVRAVQLRIRVYDVRNKLSRQISIVQDL